MSRHCDSCGREDEEVIAVHRVCPLDRVTAVLTDDEGASGAHEALTSAGVTLLRASGTQRPSLTEAG